MWSCSQGICSLGGKLRIRNKMNYERLSDTKWCINDVYLDYITFQYWDWFWLWRSGWVLLLLTVWEKMIVCCHFIWILNLGGISYHKTASLAGVCPIHWSPSLGSPQMRSPCRMAFPFLLVPFWGLPCVLLFPCLFFTLPFFSLCLSCLCSLSLRTLLPDSDFLWLSEFNFHFLKLIHLLIIHIEDWGPG